MVGVCYLVSNALEYAIHETYENQRFHISYEYGVYTVTAAGNIYNFKSFNIFFPSTPMCI